MGSYNKEYLSGSTTGRPIALSAVASPGTIIHTASTNAAVKDEVWLWVHNTDSASRTVTVQFGGTTAADNIATLVSVAARASVLVCPGIPIGAGLVVRAFADTANLLNAYGYVNRISA